MGNKPPWLSPGSLFRVTQAQAEPGSSQPQSQTHKHLTGKGWEWWHASLPALLIKHSCTNSSSKVETLGENWAVVNDDKAVWIFLFSPQPAPPVLGLSSLWFSSGMSFIIFEGLTLSSLQHRIGLESGWTPITTWCSRSEFFLTRLKTVLSCALVVFSVSANSPKYFLPCQWALIFQWQKARTSLSQQVSRPPAGPDALLVSVIFIVSLFPSLSESYWLFCQGLLNQKILIPQMKVCITTYLQLQPVYPEHFSVTCETEWLPSGLANWEKLSHLR